MANLRVNPTRMELLRLRKRLTLAQKGHKLLKQKRDGLMQEFLKIVREAQALRAEVENGLAGSLTHFKLARLNMDPKATELLKDIRVSKASLKASEKNVMGVKIPEFEIEVTETGEDYGTWEMSPQLDLGMESFKTVLPKMMQLAAIEKAAQLLATEIEKTRRRVNALEYVLIPQLTDTTKYIRMRLDEQERAAIITTMAVKESIG